MWASVFLRRSGRLLMRQQKAIELCIKTGLVCHVITVTTLFIIFYQVGDVPLVDNIRMTRMQQDTSAVRVANSLQDLPVLNITNAPWYSAPLLPRSLSQFEHDQYIRLLEQLARLFFQANITFLMCDGTLLGSYVAHDLLPWDDDLDLMVRYEDLPKVKKIFRDPSLWSTYEIRGYHDSGNEYDLSVLQSFPEDASDTTYYQYTEPNPSSNSSSKRFHKFKFYYKNSPNAGNKPWHWPFIDIKYYMENDTHVWNLDDEHRTRTIPWNDFYPLHLRPFSWLWLPAPHLTREYLIRQFRRFWCRSSRWSHREEHAQKSRKVRCWRLAHYYPFVWREELEDGVLEVLRIDGAIIQYVGVSEKYNSMLRPFAL